MQVRLSSLDCAEIDVPFSMRPCIFKLLQHTAFHFSVADVEVRDVGAPMSSVRLLRITAARLNVTALVPCRTYGRGINATHTSTTKHTPPLDTTSMGPFGTLSCRSFHSAAPIVVNALPEILISGTVALAWGSAIVWNRVVQPWMWTKASREWPTTTATVIASHSMQTSEPGRHQQRRVDACSYWFAYRYSPIVNGEEADELVAERVSFWELPSAASQSHELGPDVKRRAQPYESTYVAREQVVGGEDLYWAQRLQGQYPLGTTISVRYYPEDPTMSCIDCEDDGPDTSDQILTRVFKSVFVSLLSVVIGLIYLWREFTSEDYLVVQALERLPEQRIGEVERGKLVRMVGRVQQVKVAPPPMLRSPFRGLGCVQYSASVHIKRKTPGSPNTTWVPLVLAEESAANDFEIHDGDGSVHVQTTRPYYFESLADSDNVFMSEWCHYTKLPPHVMAMLNARPDLDLAVVAGGREKDGLVQWSERITTVGSWVKVTGVVKEVDFGSEEITVANSIVNAPTGIHLVVDAFGRPVRDSWALICSQVEEGVIHKPSTDCPTIEGGVEDGGNKQDVDEEGMWTPPEFVESETHWRPHSGRDGHDGSLMAQSEHTDGAHHAPNVVHRIVHHLFVDPFVDHVGHAGSYPTPSVDTGSGDTNDNGSTTTTNTDTNVNTRDGFDVSGDEIVHFDLRGAPDAMGHGDGGTPLLVDRWDTKQPVGASADDVDDVCGGAMVDLYAQRTTTTTVSHDNVDIDDGRAWGDELASTNDHRFNVPYGVDPYVSTEGPDVKSYSHTDETFVIARAKVATRVLGWWYGLLFFESATPAVQPFPNSDRHWVARDVDGGVAHGDGIDGGNFPSDDPKGSLLFDRYASTTTTTHHNGSADTTLGSSSTDVRQNDDGIDDGSTDVHNKDDNSDDYGDELDDQALGEYRLRQAERCLGLSLRVVLRT